MLTLPSVPAETLGALDAAGRAHRLEQLLTRGEIAAWVALDEGERIVGCCTAGTSRTPQFPFLGEFRALYLLPAFQRKGLGRKLMGEAAQWMQKDLGPSAIVWTFEANAEGRRFYEALGGQLAGTLRKRIEDAGAEYPVVAYGWGNLSLFGKLQRHQDLETAGLARP